MIVRFHNLLARCPSLSDAAAVADLLRACERDEAERTEITEEAIRQAWHATSFQLQTDAWVIVTKQGRLVSYADVRLCDTGHYMTVMCVHPDYRGRGIGTLLIWLVEERARQMMMSICSDIRVALSITVSSLNHGALRLLEREGYTRTRRFWRVMIDVPDVSSQSSSQFYRNGKLRLNMVVDVQHYADVQGTQQAGMYVARQYDVYTKLLRPGVVAQALEGVEHLCEPLAV
jgi:ribosomal protein S18 acetylase RimI-like enzyme